MQSFFQTPTFIVEPFILSNLFVILIDEYSREVPFLSIDGIIKIN